MSDRTAPIKNRCLWVVALWTGAAIVGFWCGALAAGSARVVPARLEAAPEPDVRTVTLASKVFGNSRTLRVYLPPGYEAPESARAKFPALYLNDGFAAFSARAWDAPHLLDELIRARTIEPLIVVGIDNAASIAGATEPARDRAAEYLPYPDATEPDVPSPRGQLYPKFLFNEVMPLVEGTFRADPRNVGLGGSSYGAIAALYSCINAPRPISRLLLESPPLFMFRERLTTEAARAVWPKFLYVGLGTKETDDPDVLAKGKAAVERFVAAARRAGIRVSLNEVEGASHNSAAWKARFPAAMSALYGAR